MSLKNAKFEKKNHSNHYYADKGFNKKNLESGIGIWPTASRG